MLTPPRNMPSYCRAHSLNSSRGLKVVRILELINVQLFVVNCLIVTWQRFLIKLMVLYCDLELAWQTWKLWLFCRGKYRSPRTFATNFGIGMCSNMNIFFLHTFHVKKGFITTISIQINCRDFPESNLKIFVKL